MNAQALTPELFEEWATSKDGPVALHLKQKLLPLEGETGVIFPPTYADIGYNIDTLSDGTKVAMIDSVGSQANRMEPIFKAAPEGEEANPLADLVPQLEIVLRGGKKGEEEESVSILDLAHRIADAAVMASPSLSGAVAEAFEKLRKTGNAAPLCALAPTSLVFGVWDSRGGSGEKRPRLVRSMVRAWDVDELKTSSQFNSVSKRLDEEQNEELKKESEKKTNNKRSVAGLADAPSVFVKNDKISRYVNNGLNPAARIPGGVVVRGRLERDVTVNLVALRAIRGENPEETKQLRRYLLSLALLAATNDIDLFLREGCLLRYADEDDWKQVPRRGAAESVDLSSNAAREVILRFAKEGAKHFANNWPKELKHSFDLKAAKKLMEKKATDESEES